MSVQGITCPKSMFKLSDHCVYVVRFVGDLRISLFRCLSFCLFVCICPCMSSFVSVLIFLLISTCISKTSRVELAC